MTRPTDFDIIGARPARPPASLGPLFEALRDDRVREEATASAELAGARRSTRTPDEAEAEIRRDFLEPESPPAPMAPLTEAERDAVRARMKTLVRPRLVERALARVNLPKPGITADDVHELIAQAGLSAALGTEQRAWSWIGPWLEELAREGVLVALAQGGEPAYRRSSRPGSHGNLQRIYVHPHDLRARRVA